MVLDRNGRYVKKYPLPDGLATLGSDPACDIRVMLPTVCSHHATVVVHANQTVVRNIGDGDTLVNGEPVSVAALKHYDVITLGDRSLRWHYDNPNISKKFQKIEQGVYACGRGGRVSRRASAAASGPARDRALRLALEMSHRASMPGSTGGKQVAIVQPQRRDTTDQNDQNQTRPPTNKRSRNADVSHEEDNRKRRSTKASPRNASLQDPTKATLWIESRKTKKSPKSRSQTPTVLHAPNTRRTIATIKKSTPLRLTVLRKAQSAQKMRVMKIEAPTKIDHTKQAALMLMTGHTPKQRLLGSKSKTPSYVVKKHSPVRRNPRGRLSLGKRSKESESASSSRLSNTRASSVAGTSRSSGNRSVTIFEVTDSEARNSTLQANRLSRRSGQKSPQKSPFLPSAKKSALKDPKRNTRKTESIKFDLSNLENGAQMSSDVLTVNDTTKRSDGDDTMSEEELTLRYSDSPSPSPRRPINSRSSRILESTIGTRLTVSPKQSLTQQRPRGRKSSRGSLILQKALTSSDLSHDLSSQSTSIASAYKTRTLSPRTRNMESYSIVDLVSIDSNDSQKNASVYDSVASASDSFGTPGNSISRKTRSTIDPTLLGTSTPYVAKSTRSGCSFISNRSRSNPGVSGNETLHSRSSMSTRRSKSLTTPENTRKHISINSTKISRVSRSRSRINDSDLLVDDEEDSSPKTSKRVSRNTKSLLSNATFNKRNEITNGSVISSTNEGNTTPEDRHSPEDVGTPMLSIQTLLNNSSITSRNIRTGRVSKRKTVGDIGTVKNSRAGLKSKSLNVSAMRAVLRSMKGSPNNSDVTDEDAPQPDDEEVITPKSAVKPVQEAVKNKHSTAKKPQSKRSIIDDLNKSDIVKELFNSPVKRKLSQSMTEFSRKQLFEEDEDVISVKKPSRNTIAVADRTPDSSILDQTEAITPDMFISPINTPSHSPNMTGIRRLFRRNTPQNDLRDVAGVRTLFRSPRHRKSNINDLTNVRNLEQDFAECSTERLSDARVKNVSTSSPRNDQQRVSEVKTSFQKQNKYRSPRNDLNDVRGVKELFRRSPTNDLRNVSAVKRTLQRLSPKNDLTDVRGVRNIFRQQKQKQDCDVSGIEELFNESRNDSEILFDQLVGGKPRPKAVYSRTFTARAPQKLNARKNASLNKSINMITDNVEEWIETNLRKCLQKDKPSTSLTRELKRLATSTFEGDTPIRRSRVRDSTVIRSIITENRQKSASEVYSARKLPIKKRSLKEISMERAANTTILPIKKRVVVHSTPVKGRVNMTMNASELGRVSPIAAFDKTRPAESDTTVAASRPIEDEPARPPPKQRGRRTTKAKIEKPATNEIIPSPKKTRSKAKPASPVKTRPTRGRNRTDNSDNTKKRRASLVIPKKSPVLSPKPTKVSRNKNDDIEIEIKVLISPKKITRRQKQIEVTASPKRTTRAKVQKTTVVVTKPSPKLKPRAKRNAAQIDKANSVEEIIQKSKRNRKTTVESPKESRAAKPAVENEPKTRGRRIITERQNEDDKPKRGRNTKTDDTTKVSKEDNLPKTRRSKLKVPEKQPVTRGKAKNVEVPASEITQKSTRGKKLEPQESVQSEPVRQTRRVRNDNTVIPEQKGRKRKTVVEEVIPAKTSRRGKKVVENVDAEAVSEEPKINSKKSQEINKSVGGGKTTRAVQNKRVAVSNTAERKVQKGTKTAKQEIVPEANSRKRIARAESSPAKVPNKRQALKTKKEVEAATIVSPLKTRPRSTRAAKSEAEVSKKTTSRSRRR